MGPRRKAERNFLAIVGLTLQGHILTPQSYCRPNIPRQFGLRLTPVNLVIVECVTLVTGRDEVLTRLAKIETFDGRGQTELTAGNLGESRAITNNLLFHRSTLDNLAEDHEINPSLTCEAHGHECKY